MWWQRRRETNEDEAINQEAEKAMAAIFTPSHSGVKKVFDVDNDNSGRSGVHLIKEPEPVVSTKITSIVKRKDNVMDLPLEGCKENEESLTFRALPPCPIVGYTLQEEGLVDELIKPPKVLSVTELKSLILELSSIEQQAKYTVDVQLPQQVHNRGRRSLELVVNPALYICGLYLMLWRAPRLYYNASPRGSLFFTRLFALMRWHLPEMEKERLARNHRRIFQATNAQVTLSFFSGCFLTTVAFLTHPSPDVIDSGPDIEIGKQSVGFQQHSEGALRWLWYVYYHHPAYRYLAKETRPPILRSTGTSERS
ncbi:uncharacterized protein TM35_000152900 [Trypanosoma theileri]|uniref:Uncharacterized protein n=1 Tax=Trypanosoma theileri TaxID=67003 RepID=A0A1X0NXB4_9TRYP|nr:uncharacterized protein TM35_000152900 [Trypanosoma theileri]ORC88859.1 hypothetical protein TM35_000152900 [Trypanosoma theileri]